MGEKSHLICNKCKKPMIMRRADFTYLEHTFHTDVYRCPACGMVYIPQELAEGKMAEVEVTLEDK